VPRRSLKDTDMARSQGIPWRDVLQLPSVPGRTSMTLCTTSRAEDRNILGEAGSASGGCGARVIGAYFIGMGSARELC